MSGSGRWEISYPPTDSLAIYDWPDELAFELDEQSRERIRDAVAELSRMAEGLPDDWMVRPSHGFQWRRFSDIARYNRVQGPSVGLGYEFRPGPAFTTLHLAGRFGISDRRFTGSVVWRRDDPAGAFAIAAYRTVNEAEPWTDGQGFGQSLNTLFTGHDAADYHLALGGSISWHGYRGFSENLQVSLAAERHRSMPVEAGWIGGGAAEMRPNPAVAEADFLRLRLLRELPVGPHRVKVGAESLLGRDLGTAGSPTLLGARGWVSARIGFRLTDRSGTLSLKTGYVAGDPLPQLLYRVGGPATVRGHPYGVRGGDAFWAAQLDWALASSWILSPVVFADAGGTFTCRDPAIGVGAGVSLLGGWMRFNLAKGFRPSQDIRFDLLFGAPR